jgi:mono/diheme cytochrome c family protein
MGCHGRDGSGQPGRVPSLRRTLLPLSSLPQGREFLIRVPGVAQAPLSDEDIAAVLNWMLRHVSDVAVGTGFQDYSAAEVHRQRSRPLSGVRAARRRLLRQAGLDELMSR